jgi:3-deoxy-D-manno-octulosonic-acid transferase
VPWLLDLAYLGLIVALTPFWFYRRFVLRKGLGNWRQKLCGSLPQRSSGRPCIWLHAVSVGEVTQLRPVLASLIEEHPGFEFLISTTTRTGYEVAKKHYPEHSVCYFPLDFSWAVSRALERVRPAAIVLVELELWPNFIFAASRRGIPISLINGRLTERSLKGYRWIRPLMRVLFRRLNVLAIQNETYAARFRELVADGFHQVRSRTDSARQPSDRGSTAIPGDSARRESVHRGEHASS